MTSSQHRLTRKGLLLLVLLTLLILLGPLSPPRPAMACDPLLCPWSPPTHWDCGYNACVCDCPIDPFGDPTNWSNCGPCV
jgi:hypothetical protein